MKPYSATNQAEKEAYDQYKSRKELDWAERLKTICVEINDSSLKEHDKESIAKKLLIEPAKLKLENR